MKYAPKPVPVNGALNGYLREELARIGSASDQASAITLTELAAAPDKIEDGQLIYANGSDYDPGDGEGFYGRVNGSWQTLVGVQPDESETISGDWTINGDWTFTGTLDFTSATLADSLTIESTTDAALYIKADTDNATETDNPFIRMEQDGNAVQAVIGLTGATDVDAEGNVFTGASANALGLHALWSGGTLAMGVGGEVGLRFASNNDATFTNRVTFEATRSGIDGSINLESTNPQMNFIETGLGTDLGHWNVGATSSDFLVRSMNDDGTNGETALHISRSGSGSALSDIQVGCDLQVMTGHELKIWDSDTSDSMNLFHSGTEAIIELSDNTSDWKVQVNAANRIVYDTSARYLTLIGAAGEPGVFRAQSPTSGEECNMTCGESGNGYVGCNSGSDQGLFLLPSATITAADEAGNIARAGIITWATQLASDEETVTVDLQGLDGGFVFIVASTTSSAETGSSPPILYFSGTTMITVVAASTGGVWAVGSGSNPNTDGDHNVWRSADGVLSIKNRRGSSRYYSVYVLAGA